MESRESVDKIVSEIRKLRLELSTGPIPRAQLQQETKASNRVMDEYERLFNRGNGSRFPAPPGKEELGNHTWTLLHTMAAYWPQKPPPQQVEDGKEFITLLSRLYPCTDCAGHFRELLQKYPPRLGTQREFIQWVTHVHNKVNMRLEKPYFHTKDHQKRWWSANASTFHADH